MTRMVHVYTLVVDKTNAGELSVNGRGATDTDVSAIFRVAATLILPWLVNSAMSSDLGRSTTW